MKQVFITRAVAASVVVDVVTSFSVHQLISTRSARSSVSKASSQSLQIMMSKKNDGELPKGMEDAFRQLDELKSIDDGVDVSRPDVKKKQDEAFAKAMLELDLKDIETEEPAPIESEVKLYKELATELETSTETDIIDDVKSDLGASPTEFPKFDPSNRDNDKFMEEALEQALEEAEKKAQMEINKDSLLDNKEIMEEIEKIFDKANSELLEGIEEMRKEQMVLAKESATRNAKQSQDRIDEEQERLAVAEANMRKMLDKVNQETKNVESAIQDLKQAQVDMEGGVDDQLISLKSGGIVKQAALVGSLLFSFRSLVEGSAYLAGDPTHLMPATLQTVIAIVCIIGFIFL